MERKKQLEDSGKTDFVAIKSQLNHLGMPCLARAHLFVGGVCEIASGVTAGYRKNAFDFAKRAIQAPETTAPQGTDFISHGVLLCGTG
jgi:hypothetical protein